jgi:hypothetical protein
MNHVNMQRCTASLCSDWYSTRTPHRNCARTDQLTRTRQRSTICHVVGCVTLMSTPSSPAPSCPLLAPCTVHVGCVTLMPTPLPPAPSCPLLAPCTVHVGCVTFMPTPSPRAQYTSHSKQTCHVTCRHSIAVPLAASSLHWHDGTFLGCAWSGKAICGFVLAALLRRIRRVSMRILCTPSTMSSCCSVFLPQALHILHYVFLLQCLPSTGIAHPPLCLLAAVSFSPQAVHALHYAS